MSRSRKQPYRQSRRFDKSCRCHGGCPQCRGDKLYQDTKARGAAELQIKTHDPTPSDDGRFDLYMWIDGEEVHA